MQNAEIKRNLQYLKVLKTQKQNMVAEQKELENQIASLRKNPADKLTTDLYIFQYNKKIEGLKENVSSTNKEITRVSKELEGIDLSELDEDDKDEFKEEILDITPQEEPVEEEVIKQDITPIKQNNFKALISSYNSIPKLILLALLSFFSAWILYQIDVSNMILTVSIKTKFQMFSFILLGAFTFLIATRYLYKEIISKPFGCFSDYFMLYNAILTLIMIVLCVTQYSPLKLAIVIGLSIYSLVYFVIRLALSNKDVSKTIQNSKFLTYYKELFSKYSITVIGLISIILFCSLYVLISYNIIPKWLNGTPKFFNSKLWMIIDIILLGLLLAYAVAFSIINLKEKDLKIIDLGALLAQVACFVFLFFATIKYGKVVGVFSYIFFALLFAISTFVTIYRIINVNKNEI